MVKAGAEQEQADRAQEAEPRVHSTPVRTTRASAAAAAGAAEGQNMGFGAVAASSTPASARPTTTAEPSSSQLVSNEGSASEGEGKAAVSGGPGGPSTSTGGTPRAAGPFSSGSTQPRGKEYLFLSHTFVHQKLKAFAPPCQIEVQIESDGEMQQRVYQGMLQDSSAKGYYMLTAPPREPLVNKEIFGLRLKSDGRIILQIKDRSRPLNVDEGRRRLNPRVIGITTSIRVDFLKACFREISEPRHAISVKIEVNGVRQPELFTGASISHNRQGSFYVLGLPFALVHGREFVAWRQLDETTLELAVQDVDPTVAAAAAARLGAEGAGSGSAYSRRAASSGIVVDSRISIPLAMLKRDLADHLESLLPGGLGPSFDIPARVQYRVDGKMLPRIYDQAVIKKSEHRGCCYLNGTERIPVKSKVLCGLEMQTDQKLVILDFKSQGNEELPRRNSPSVPGTSPIGRGTNIAEALSSGPSRLGKGSATAASAKEIIEKLTAGGMAHSTAKELAAALVQAAEVAVAADAVTSAEPGSRRGKRGASNPTTPRANIIGAGGDAGVFAPAPASAGGTGRSRLACTAGSTLSKGHADGTEDEGEEDEGGDVQGSAQRPRSVMRRTAAEVVRRATKADGGFDEEEMLAAAAALAGPLMSGAGNGVGSTHQASGRRRGAAGSGKGRRGRRAAGSDATETDTESEASEEEAAEEAELKALERREKRGQRASRRGGAKGPQEDEADEEAGGKAAGAVKQEEVAGGGPGAQGVKPADQAQPARRQRVRYTKPAAEDEGEEDGDDPLAALQWVVRRPRTGLPSTSSQPIDVAGLQPANGRARRPDMRASGGHVEGESSFDDLVAAASHLSEQQGTTPAKRSRLASTAATHPTPGSKGRGRAGRGRSARAADSDEEPGQALAQQEMHDPTALPGSLQGFSGQQMLQIIQMQQEAVAQNLIAQALAQQQVQAAQAHASTGTPSKKQKSGAGGTASPGLAPGAAGLGFPGLGLGLGGIAGSPLVNPLAAALLTGGLGLGLGAGSPLNALALASPGMAGLPLAADTSAAGPSAGSARKRKRAGDTRGGSDEESDGQQLPMQAQGLGASIMAMDPMTAALFGGALGGGALGGLGGADLASFMAFQQAAALQQQQQLMAAAKGGEAPKIEGS